MPRRNHPKRKKTKKQKKTIYNPPKGKKGKRQEEINEDEYFF